MKRIVKSTAIASALIMGLSTSAAMAQTAQIMPISAPITQEELGEDQGDLHWILPVLEESSELHVDEDGTVSHRGYIRYNELETGFYEIDGWRLIGDVEQFKLYEGGQVVVKGKISDEVSIFMTKAIEVSELIPITRGDFQITEGEEGEKADLIMAPAPVKTAYGDAILGPIQWTELEGGFYSAGGYGLIGDDEVIASLKDKEALFIGQVFDGISFRMVAQWEVEHMAVKAANRSTLPGSIKVNGKAITADQGAVVVDGKLMVPLRAVVEAAGGKVVWNALEQTVIVEMADRHAIFALDKAEAELNENGVNYFTRNLLKLDSAPMTVNGRTLVSVETLSTILNMWEIVGAEGLELITIAK